MRVGQTSFVVFSAKLVGAFVAFVATILFARVLGAEIYGLYAVLIALVAWLKLFGTLGIGNATKKRISEGKHQDEYFTAGIIWILALTVVISGSIFLGERLLMAYISGFEDHVANSIVWFVLMLLFVKVSYAYVSSTLQGEKLVHISGLLDPLSVTLKSIFQVGLVLVGYSLAGMLFGFALGAGIATVIGISYITLRPKIPNKEHLTSLFEYAKYSWLGTLKSQSYQDVDILVLGAMVQSSLVGIYAIAWSLTKVLRLFGIAVSQSVFPEISSISTQEGMESTVSYVEDAVAYTGLIVIPGFVGGAILDERLLALYGGEFIQGTEVLWLLLLGVIAYGYMRQFLNVLNALDHPELSFWTNLVFILSNVALNIVLIWYVGWVGAAIASLVSATLGMLLAYILLVRVLPFSIPLGEIGRQVLAAGVMGVVVLSLDVLVRHTEFVQHNAGILVVLVTVGLTVYSVVLLAIAPQFREVISRNIPKQFWI